MEIESGQRSSRAEDELELVKHIVYSHVTACRQWNHSRPEHEDGLEGIRPSTTVIDRLSTPLQAYYFL